MSNNGKKFVYLSIYEDIQRKIDSEEWKPGARLPNELDMMEEYKVSRGTVRKALSKLELDGYISRKVAIGSFVKFRKVDYTLARMESYSEQMRRIHVEPSSELLSIELTATPPHEAAEALALNKNEKVYCITRLRRADGEPMAYEMAYVPSRLCPNLHTHITDTSSLYEIYEKVYGLKLKFGLIELEAELADEPTQRVLNVKKGSPMLKMVCSVTLEDDSPLYYVKCYYIGEKYKFSTRLPR